MVMQRRLLLITIGAHSLAVREALARSFAANNPARVPADEVRLRVAALHLTSITPLPATTFSAGFIHDTCTLTLTENDLQMLYHDPRVRRWSSVNWGEWRDALPATRLWSNLALFHHHESVRTAIANAINRIGSSDKPLHIYLAAALHDPFASIVIDVATMAHRAARDNDRVFGVLMLPDMEGDPMTGSVIAHQANAYASLRELCFYENVPSFYSDHQNPSDLDATRFRLFDDDLRDTSPFLRGDTYLIGGATRESGEPLSYHDAVQAAADLIYWQTASPLCDRIAVTSHGTGRMSAFGIATTRIRTLDDVIERRRRTAFLMLQTQRGGEGAIDLLPVRRLIDAPPIAPSDQLALRDGLDLVRTARQSFEALMDSIPTNEQVLRVVGAVDIQTGFTDAARTANTALHHYRDTLISANTHAAAVVRDIRLAEELKAVIDQPGITISRSADAHRELIRIARSTMDRATEDAENWNAAARSADQVSARNYARLFYDMQPTSGTVALLVIALLGFSGAGLLFSMSDALVPFVLLLLAGLLTIYWSGVVAARRADRTRARDQAIESYLIAVDANRQHIEAIVYMQYVQQVYDALCAHLLVSVSGEKGVAFIANLDEQLRAGLLAQTIASIVMAERGIPPRDLTIPADLSSTLARELLYAILDTPSETFSTSTALEKHILDLVQRNGLIDPDHGGLSTLPVAFIAEKVAHHAPLTLLSLDVNYLSPEDREPRMPLVAAIGWSAPDLDQTQAVVPIETEAGVLDDMILIRYRNGIPVHALLPIREWKRSFIQQCKYRSSANTHLFSRAFLHPTRIGTACPDLLVSSDAFSITIPYLPMVYTLFTRWFASRTEVETICAFLGIAVTHLINWDEFCGAVGDNPVLVRDALREGARLVRGRSLATTLDVLRQSVERNRPNASEFNADWELWITNLILADLTVAADVDSREAEVQSQLVQLFIACTHASTLTSER